MSYDESNSAVAVPAAATVVGLEEGFALDADAGGGGTTEPISSDGEGPTSPRLFLKEAVGGGDHEGHDDVDVESGGGGDGDGEKKKKRMKWG